MCITTKQSNYAVAQEDIVCWKVLEILESKDGEKRAVTPFAYVTVPDKVLNGEKPFVPDKQQMANLDAEIAEWWNSDEYRDGEHEATLGLIHTYGGSVEDLKPTLNYHREFIDAAWDVHTDDDVVSHIVSVALWECVIPKGTEYLEGDMRFHRYGDDNQISKYDVHSYASKAILFKKKVAEFYGEGDDPDTIVENTSEANSSL